MGYIWIILVHVQILCNFVQVHVQILGAIGQVIRVSEPKTEMPNVGLNSSSSKINRTSGIKVSNLKASGQAVLALKNKLWRSDTFFLFIFGTSATLCVECPYVFSGQNYEFGNKNKKRYNFDTATDRHLKFRSIKFRSDWASSFRSQK